MQSYISQVQHQISILIVTILLLTACQGGPTSVDNALEFVDTTKGFKCQIPTYDNGEFDIFYKQVKSKQKQLGLDKIERGYNNLQIRIWTDSSFVKNQRVIIIAHQDKTWKATVFSLKVDWDGESETIVSKNKTTVTPKSGWTNFSKKLLDLKILTLPDSYQIPNYGGRITDGHTYNIEIATKSQYRFYSYSNPEMLQYEYWQAKNMTEILRLLSRELAF